MMNNEGAGIEGAKGKLINLPAILIELERESPDKDPNSRGWGALRFLQQFF